MENWCERFIKFDTGTSLKWIFTWCWLVLKEFLTFLLAKNTRNKPTPNQNLFQFPSSIKCGISHTQVFTHINNCHFLLILDNLKNAYLTLIIISQVNDNEKLKPIYQNLSWRIGSPNIFHLLKSLFWCVFYTWSNRSTFSGSPSIYMQNPGPCLIPGPWATFKSQISTPRAIFELIPGVAQGGCTQLELTETLWSPKRDLEQVYRIPGWEWGCTNLAESHYMSQVLAMIQRWGCLRALSCWNIADKMDMLILFAE